MKKNTKKIVGKSNMNTVNQLNNGHGTLNLQDIVNYTQNSTFILPSLQRDAVWKMDGIAKLFDSIYKEYPIGTILLLNVGKGDNYINFYTLNTNENGEFFSNERYYLQTNTTNYCILDGQQRITAIYKGLFKPFNTPTKNKSWQNNYLYFNCLSTGDDIAFKYFKDDESTILPNCLYIKLKDIWYCKDGENVDDEIDSLISKWINIGNKIDSKKHKKLFKIYEDTKNYINNNIILIKNNLTKLITILNTTLISYNLISFNNLDDEEKLKRISNIFIRLNSGGQKLTPADLLYSQIAALSKEKIDNIREQFKSFNARLNKEEDASNFQTINNFMRLLWLLFGDSSFRDFKDNKDQKLKNCINNPNMKKAFDSLLWARNVYKNKKFSFNGKISYNMFLPIAYYKFYCNLTNKDDKKLAQAQSEIAKYYQVALCSDYFSQHVDNSLVNLKKAMTKNNSNGIALFGDEIFNFEKLQDQLGNNKIKITKEKLNEILDYDYTENKEDVLKILYLLYKETININDIVETVNEVRDIDHMHPKFLSDEQRYKDSVTNFNQDTYEYFKTHYNKLPNLQPLISSQNRTQKNQKPLKEWLKTYHGQDLANYAIENFVIEKGKIDFDYFDLANFKTFYEARKAIIEKRLKKMLNI